jgi:ribosomal protein S18 acetylase RimI-like enzyme
MSQFTIRPLTPADRGWVAHRIAESWGAEVVVAHGVLYRPADLSGLAAEAGDEIIGLLTCHIEGKACEIVTLDSWRERLGVGSALIEAARQAARQAGCRRLWLVTTNDNTHALRFYQKRGFTIAAVHVNAIEKSRQLKPEIPLTGMDGIPIRDEIEFEMSL